MATRRHVATDPDQLQGEADVDELISWDVSVDSTVARAHQHAAGARKSASMSVVKR
jgi:hypothetical protein